MANEFFQPEIELQYADLMNALKSFEKEMPGVGRKLIAAVNTEAKKRIRKAYRGAGYSAKKIKSWGDAGYSKNLKSYANKDFSGKILMTKNAFHYKFLEFGTHHNAMTVHRNGQTYQVKSFTIPARPILYPVANAVWKTNIATEIMEKKFQEALDKKFKGK